MYNGYIRIDRAKTGETPFLLYFGKNMKKTTKKITEKIKRIKKKAKSGILTFGDINPDQGRILLLVIAIIFAATALVVTTLTDLRDDASVQVAHQPLSNRNVSFERQASNLVKGYPISKMTPYLFTKDPKVAAFMIAIAKKESAWGKRVPVLAGKDCFNYWGFRLKSERMGSGGHTCFDSPQQAVDVVASRIDELVNEENLDSAKDLIVWKCGYGCQDAPKTSSENKWISDVDIYYKKLEGYL